MALHCQSHRVFSDSGTILHLRPVNFLVALAVKPLIMVPFTLAWHIAVSDRYYSIVLTTSKLDDYFSVHKIIIILKAPDIAIGALLSKRV